VPRTECGLLSGVPIYLASENALLGSDMSFIEVLAGQMAWCADSVIHESKSDGPHAFDACSETYGSLDSDGTGLRAFAD
jgi:hypothetical protein